MKIKDQLNNILIFDKVPKRIVSLVPSITELLVDLGLEDYLIGITKFCVHPTYLKKRKTIVGGTKNINFQKIKKLQPDIIICNKEENTQEIVDTLKKTTLVYVSDIVTIEDTFEMISSFGKIFNIKTITKKLLDDITFKFNNFNDFIKEKSIRKVAYFIWSKPWMVVGDNNFINEMLKLNKFKNIFENQERYPKIELNILTKLNPELILLSSEPYPFKEKHKQHIKKYTNANIIFVDGEFFSWYGSRFLKGLDYFKTLHQ